MSQTQKTSIAILPGETQHFCRWLDYQQVSTTEQMAVIQGYWNKVFPENAINGEIKEEKSKYLSLTQLWLSSNEKLLKGLGHCSLICYML